jgi:hypothetical protein
MPRRRYVRSNLESSVRRHSSLSSSIGAGIIFCGHFVPEGPQDVAQHCFSNIRTGLNGTDGCDTPIPHTGCGVFSQMGKEVVEPGGLTPIIQAACAALVLGAPVVSSGCMQMGSSYLLAACTIRPHHHPCQNAGTGKPKREKNKHRQSPYERRSARFFARAASTHGAGIHRGIRFGTDHRGALVFRICLAHLRWLDFGYGDGPHDANGRARPGRLIADLKLVGVSNPYQFD